VIPFAGTATAASASADGRSIAILSYTSIHVFRRGRTHPLPDGPVRRIALTLASTAQVESIAWDGAGLVFGNEQRALFRIPDPFAPGLDAYLPPSGATPGPTR